MGNKLPTLLGTPRCPGNVRFCGLHCRWNGAVVQAGISHSPSQMWLMHTALCAGLQHWPPEGLQRNQSEEVISIRRSM